MKTSIANLLTDFYKIDHVRQYPEGVTRVYSNWTARKSRVPGIEKVVVFGHQYFLIELIQLFNESFFNLPWNEVEAEYVRVISKTLGIQNPKTDHIKALHDEGRLPINIYAIPEGYSVNIGIPSLVIYNTVDHAFWLPNFLETILSLYIWKPYTSATTALEYRRIGMEWARKAGETDFGFIDYQFHDFSMRGMSGFGDTISSGMGHLLSFNGTDSIPAILAAEKYYDANIAVTGSSIPATEHSVMCAGGKEDEFETFRRLIEDIYPEGFVSIVSDTWDLWTVLTDFIPRLKDNILTRNGKIVLRPDSGDPVEIVLGKNNTINRERGTEPADLGVLALLKEVFGVNETGMINKAGCIYGDSITLDRARQILSGIVEKLKISPYNMVFGVGSFTYEYVTRDTFGFAMKATAIEKDGKVIPIFKDPKTDSGMKKSRKGILAVYKAPDWTPENNNWICKEEATLEELENCDLTCILKDGILNKVNFETIKERVRVQS
jgi:nicotinamide phosphoribosyltransferase